MRWARDPGGAGFSLWVLVVAGRELPATNTRRLKPAPLGIQSIKNLQICIHTSECILWRFAIGLERMAIPPGTRIGPYEIQAAIGAGGMGEVYRAHDTKLARDVAIKVLPANFVNDPERLSRFQREARMLAALNHPNIATIFGLEQSAG